MNGARARRVALFVLTWAVVAVPVGLLTFTHSHITTTVAGHDAVVSPTFDGYATLDLGPYVPNLRYPSGQRLGSAIDLGPTRVTSYEGLIRRYAAIGTQPEGEIGKIAASLGDMAIRSALVGALAGLLCPGVWVLLGSRRRAELSRQVTARRTAAAGLSGVLVVLGLVQPWDAKDPALQEPSSWQPIARALPGVPVPARARPLEVESGLFTRGTRRLAESMLDSYRRGSPSTPSWRGRCRTSPTRSTPLARPRRLLSWSATATTTSAWTRCFGRSAPRAGRRSCSTQATTPRPAPLGRHSASTRWTGSSPTTTTGTRWSATTTRATSSAGTSTT